MSVSSAVSLALFVDYNDIDDCRRTQDLSNVVKFELLGVAALADAAAKIELRRRYPSTFALFGTHGR